MGAVINLTEAEFQNVSAQSVIIQQAAISLNAERAEVSRPSSASTGSPLQLNSGDRATPTAAPNAASESAGTAAKSTGGAAAEGEAGAAAGGAEAAVGGAAALAPPLLAIYALNQVAAATAKAIASVGEAAESASASLASMASNNNVQGFNDAAESAAKLAGGIPIVGQVLQATAESAIKLEKAFFDVSQAFIDRGRELARYSPEVAAAGARADVRSILADAREGQALGGNLARLTDAQSELMAMIREILLPIKNAVIGELADGMEELRDWVNANRDILTGLPIIGLEMAKAIVQGLSGHIGSAIETLGGIPDKVGNAVADAMRKNDANKTPLNNFLKMIEAGRPNVQQTQVNVGGAPGLNVPILRRVG